VDTNNFLPLHDLMQHLPVPLVLFGNRSGLRVANDRFTDVFLPGQLDSPELRQLASNPGGTWQPVTLRQRDGLGRVARAQAVAVADGVLLVFEEAAGQPLAQDNERLQARVAELESLSATDSLTGAWNRVHLEHMVDVEISRAKRSGMPVTLVLLDIDHFKRINDHHGHLAGDAVLTEFVGRIRQRLRNTDLLFRWGGDEFVVLATSVGYRGGAALAEGLRRTIEDLRFAEVGPITISMGVTEYNVGESAQSWFRRTDAALYAAKFAGRNRIHVDRQGRSDGHASRAGTRMLRLLWLEDYACGDPTIDAEHRELFDLGNALIDAAAEKYSEPGLWRAALDSVLAHLARHFQSEEALMARRGYRRLAVHRRAHAGLLRRADELRAAVERGDATLSHLVNFLANDVVALHLLKMDRDFDLQLSPGNGDAARAHSSSEMTVAQWH
jgi:hemerythrin